MDTRNSKFCQSLAWKVQEVESFGLRKCPQNFLESLLTLQEVGILPTLIIFHSRGCLVEFQFPKGLFGPFYPKGLFGKLMGYGNSALF